LEYNQHSCKNDFYHPLQLPSLRSFLMDLLLPDNQADKILFLLLLKIENLTLLMLV